ncbi:hypothetical protein V1264_020372 [Littorina saxatilis]|uniref:Serine carboxypeptidase CPVL n=1 Tax=Littorina saxatilis TaxID=31220 RepID=A0AAN9GAS7_9CAEN
MWTRFPEEIFPLFLSPLIDAGRIEEAQNKSRVRGLCEDDVESYSGYITVNREYQSNMFFWFFPQETHRADAPVLLWLNGGPGRTSLVGALMENGPYEVTTLDRIKAVVRRNVSWTRHFSMLYIDNPVGVGYSFTKNDAGYSTSTKEAAENMYRVLVQFFKMFPQYSKNDFYAGGQSYAGKYVPVLGCYIHDRNTDTRDPPKITINFKGIYVGAGYCDPKNMMPAFAEFLYSAGFISDAHRQNLRSSFNKTLVEFSLSNKSLGTENYLQSFFNTPVRYIGLDSADHLLGDKATNGHLSTGLEFFINSSATRMKLHVGFAQIPKRYASWSQTAANKLTDFLTSTSKENAFLMDNYNVLHYSGNLDIVVNVPMTEAFLQHVQWSGQQQYNDSYRHKWSIGKKLAGWYTIIGNFTRVIIRNSGHMVPYDQPEAALDMMRRFIFNQPFRSA